MAKLFAYSGYPDQTPQNAASDLGLHCLPITLLGVSRLQWINISAGEMPNSVGVVLSGSVWSGNK